MQFQERQYTRYDYEAPVIFKKKDKSIWITAKILDVSLGGVLIKNEELPQLEELIEIRVVNLFNGTFISLEGKVVRIIAPPRGPGAGVEFVVPGSNRNLLRLIDILKKNKHLIAKGVSDIKEGDNDPAKVIQKCREILENAQYLDYYQTLGLPDDATFDEIIKRKKQLLDSLAVNIEKLSFNQKNLLHDAVSLVKRLTGILANPPRRLSYNVTIGKVSRDFLVVLQDKYNVDVKSHAEFWQQKYPHKIERAQELLVKVKKLKKEGNTQYLEVYRQLLELAPFFDL
ncbi:MAG: PilZ domain-containing protein [Deltaproteobacteria bacterium]|nr:PilZ domain-containing protein [Deltaproteobacteria bacterium]